jgi:RimJ/RimL family protein N-acetyltransferase
MDGYEIAPAGEADIEAMRAIETSPGYERLVGRWSAERHREEMAMPSSRYFLLRGRVIEGFAMVQGLGNDDLKGHLRRIAVREPGRGAGAVLLRAVLDRIFGETATNRLDLHVHLDNERARCAYERAGFQTEGLLRDWHRNGDGSFRTVRLMSILRRDWEARAGASVARRRP